MSRDRHDFLFTHVALTGEDGTSTDRATGTGASSRTRAATGTGAYPVADSRTRAAAAHCRDAGETAESYRTSHV